MIPFIDLTAQQQRIRAQLDTAIARVLDHGKYIMGPEIGQLEADLCDFSGSKHCITVSNGTDALIAAYMALGVGPGDAIITTPFTFYATVEAIQILGATPVFADIDPVTYNLCPHAVENAVNRVQSENRLKLKGICPVDLFGLCADYDAIGKIAQEHGLFIVQDSAQAFGATGSGKRAPSHGTIGTASFFPAKPLGCYGDGGAVFTDDDKLDELLRSIRVHGKGSDKYDNVRVGQNCRLNTLQAAILIEKLKIYQSELDSRQQVAAWYTQHIQHLNKDLNQPLAAPTIPTGFVSAWAQYTIRLENRDAMIESLKAAGIPAMVYYRTPSHLLGACAELGYQQGDFPESELAAQQVLSLPFHPYLTEEIVVQVVNALQQSVLA